MYKQHLPLRVLSLAVTLGCFLPGATFASDTSTSLLHPDIKPAKTEPVMTVSAPEISPLTVVTSLKTPRQPVPASDGFGFAIFSANVAYKATQNLKLSAGVDNLFDTAYSEHLNLAGNISFGYSANTPVNEPGRT